jgi:hypothetical protein
LKPAKRTQAKRQAALLGIGLDAEDGQTRITRGRDFVLYGGSQDTHSQMQETAIKVNEQLDKRGKQLADVSPQELRDIFESVIR